MYNDSFACPLLQETGPDKEWAGRLKASLKALYDVDYEKVASHTLWGIRLVIFVKPEHSKKIAHLQFSQVRTGIGNALGNHYVVIRMLNAL